jgi:hypothetical protein
MNTPALIAAIDAEILRLHQARKLLAGNTAIRGGKRVLSAEARARISAAAKKRWVAVKKAQKKRG